ncbi:cytochrome C oxidase subunit IV family protein [Mycobacterium sp. Marseille-P9652]|uniref:cytochrome C oxidase subunit IV family protein n=1 Tax=Mycobacterium sp. Marseille-P9652 TaxID=2654950 RepID=UPI0012E80189|nr:cytochrome C oxidase subunit IV family protein [Mycobacterium sp. Marseille-P9652]
MIRTNTRLLVAWVILASLTLAYLGIDHSAASHGANAVVTSCVIGIAVVKVRIIFREFMEVRRAPALLCRLTDAWVVLIAASLLACYFAGRLW